MNIISILNDNNNNDNNNNNSKILRLAMDSQQISQSYIYINKRITTKKT